MRFEFIILIIWLTTTLSILFLKKIDLKWKASIFLCSCYGPVYALVSIGTPPILNLSLISAIFILIFWIRRVPLKFLLAFILILLISTYNYVFFDYGFVPFFKGILSLLIGFSGLILGYKLVIKKNKKLLYIFAVIYFLLAVNVLVIRNFFAPFNDLRDAGLPLIVVSFSVYLLIKGYYFKSTSILSYLFLILSRSVQISVLYSLISNFKPIRGKYGRLFIWTFSFLSIFIIFSIIYERTFNSIGADYSSGFINATFLSRLNAMSYEFNTFLDSPIIGKGLFFYDADFKAQQLNILGGLFSDSDYLAYNHMGYTSLLAQLGIAGFLMLIIIPFSIWKKFKSKCLEDKIISQTFILYLIIFAISGSPIRTDFPDQFYYYFLIGYMIACNKINLSDKIIREY